jgi:hypothetical protein
MPYFTTGFMEPETKSNQEVKPMKLEEITQGLPLLGLRVMINPENQDRYAREIRNLSGNIISLQGTQSDANRHIRQYKQTGRASGWNVTVLFDNKEEHNLRIEHLLPIANGHIDIHFYNLSGGISKFWTKEQAEQYLDQYVIIDRRTVRKHVIYDQAYREKTFNEC